MKMIDELWYGNIMPAEHAGENNPQLRKLLHLIVKNKEILDNTLTDEQRKVLDAYADRYDEYIHILSLETFREGFCLATKIITEGLRTE